MRIPAQRDVTCPDCGADNAQGVYVWQTAPLRAGMTVFECDCCGEEWLVTPSHPTGNAPLVVTR